jgi:hypothetical protein
LDSAILFTSALLGPLILLDDDSFCWANHHATLTAQAILTSHFSFAVDQRQDFGWTSGDTFAAANAFVLVNRYYEHGITSLTEPVRPGAAGTQKNEASGKANASFLAHDTTGK